MAASSSSTAQGRRNRLAAETSPYLLQHQHNPVDWMAWGEAALARAVAEDKPILLSVGYAACHWCHVMAHESFEDPDVAAVMNALFVNIKVDREERPDLDTIYQAALQMLGENGGWPLTMFLTPKAEPFWGGTYFPKTARFGRPGFVDVLKGVAETYKRDHDKVLKNVDALRDGLARLGGGEPGALPGPAMLDRVADRLGQQIDHDHGGLGGAPKFPHCSVLEMLWRAWLRTRQQALRHGVLVSLTAMCEGGIYDHLGGGFARYSTDEHWLVPHFEKMLYDNAELVDLLTMVWRETRDPLYAQRVSETIDWLEREMLVEGAAFAGSLDADSEGVEGKFYVWTESAIDSVLGARSALFKRFYDVSPHGNWEDHVILNRRAQPAAPTPQEAEILASCRAALLAARSGRVRPGRDDKVLADWNGLMIAALAHAGQAFERPEWLSLAARAFAFVEERMTVDGRLRHSWCAGSARHPATLDDHAALARAALALFSATGDQRYLASAKRLVRLADRHYAADSGGYYAAADDTADVIVRTKTAQDNATPSGNGMMVAVLAKLWLLTGEDQYRLAAERTVAAFAGDLARNAFGLCNLLNGFETLMQGQQIVVIGSPGAADTHALLRAIGSRSLPNAVHVVVPPDAPLPPGHPAAGKPMVNGRATAYVCAGMTCAAPETDPHALLARLAG
ncbi:MAG: thioredoxin domain-containing protein [Alphaproteobacteria bacterium]|nr:thioredoxin domain-containing protein [Alphaproteobacteria bacterium]